jgi:hypothetical protein
MHLRSLAILLFTMLLFPHCDEPVKLNATGTSEESGLTGRWKQIADLYSIGDATVHARYFTDTVYKFLQFNTDSSIETNMQAFLAFKRYSLQEDSSLLFIPGDPSMSRYSYLRSGDSLDIYLRCIEACGVRLVKDR